MRNPQPIEIKGRDDWHKLMRELNPERPEKPAERPFNDDELDALEADVNGCNKSLRTQDFNTESHTPKEISDALRKLAKDSRIQLLSSIRGRYCSHQVWESWNPQRRFQEQIG